MRNSQEEFERLLKRPIDTKQGSISATSEFENPLILVSLKPRLGNIHGRDLFACSPTDWVWFAELMEAYLWRGKQKNKKSKKKGEQR